MKTLPQKNIYTFFLVLFVGGFILTSYTLLAAKVLKKQSDIKTSSSAIVKYSPNISLSGIHVVKNKLENNKGQIVKIIGINRNSTEYSCLVDKPSANAASIRAMKTWRTNAIRIPLNEDCWLGINNTPLNAKIYQKHLMDYVSLITKNNMAVILTLHWVAPGNAEALAGQPMPDQDHSVLFWKQVSKAFKNNSQVIFDLYDNPNPITYNPDYLGNGRQWQQQSFNCVLKGCMVTAGNGQRYRAAGMQELLNTVRQTGAKNIIMIEGIEYAQIITDYIGTKNAAPSGFMPSDPFHNLAVSEHKYNNTVCNNISCWNSTMIPVLTHYPIIVGEVGDLDCSAAFINSFLPWLDEHNISYIAWTWDTLNNCQALIQNSSGLPTKPYGQAYYDHLKKL